MACIVAYTVVGPTNWKPRRFSSFANAVDSGLVDAIPATVVGRSWCVGRNDHTKWDRPPDFRSSIVAFAFAITAAILRRFRIMPETCMSRSISASVNLATASGSKPWNSFRSSGRLARIVCQLRPD